MIDVTQYQLMQIIVVVMIVISRVKYLLAVMELMTSNQPGTDTSPSTSSDSKDLSYVKIKGSSLPVIRED